MTDETPRQQAEMLMQPIADRGLRDNEWWIGEGLIDAFAAAIKLRNSPDGRPPDAAGSWTVDADALRELHDALADLLGPPGGLHA